MSAISVCRAWAKRVFNALRPFPPGEGRRPSRGPMRLEKAFLRAGGVVDLASEASWRALWASKPRVVALDAEGTHFSPPLLVQVAYGEEGRVLLDVPGHVVVGAQLRRLLADESITKVFFGPPSSENLGVKMANVVDVQKVAHAAAGDRRPGHLPSLTAAAGALTHPTGLVKNVKLQRSFRFYKRRPRGYGWLSKEVRLYSAADAWATLELYNALRRTDPACLDAHTTTGAAQLITNKRHRRKGRKKAQAANAASS